MFTMDVPYVPAQQTPIVLAQAAPITAATPQPDFTFNACTEVEHVTTAFSGVNPALGLASYLERQGRSTIDLATIKITLLQRTSHGELTLGASDHARSMSAYSYDPEPEYIGKDRAVFMAEFEGKRYKIVVDIVVVEQVNENGPSVCPPPRTHQSQRQTCVGLIQLRPEHYPLDLRRPHR
ncbi:MAG: hypothetical protein KJ795_04770 [Gammaproteobacteria bacterium]|nr:hypothetical protein [Gammaproteobacteria bacterium]MBU1969338.1 hypothetical protein [Gammaproteobacteria bacterium]